MLIIRAIQVKNVEGVCEYKVAAFINAQKIWQGTVGGHTRSQGWPVLASHIARVAGLQSQDAIEDALKSIDESGDGLVHCPICNRILRHQ